MERELLSFLEKYTCNNCKKQKKKQNPSHHSERRHAPTINCQILYSYYRVRSTLIYVCIGILPYVQYSTCTVPCSSPIVVENGDTTLLCDISFGPANRILLLPPSRSSPARPRPPRASSTCGYGIHDVIHRARLRRHAVIAGNSVHSSSLPRLPHGRSAAAGHHG